MSLKYIQTDIVSKISKVYINNVHHNMIIAINMHFPDVVKSNENILYLLGHKSASEIHV